MTTPDGEISVSEYGDLDRHPWRKAARRNPELDGAFIYQQAARIEQLEDGRAGRPSPSSGARATHPGSAASSATQETRTMMNRTSNIPCLVATFLLVACGEDSTGSSSTTGDSAAATTTTATTGGEAPSSTSSSGVGGSGGSGGSAGEGGASGAGGGSSSTGDASSSGSGGNAPTPESCFAIHDQAACYEAGCNFFQFGPDVPTVVDDACVVTDDLGMCFLVDEEGIGQATPAGYVRDFEAEGPRVVGLNNVEPLIGWTRCTFEIAVEVRECCCVRDQAFGDVCNGLGHPGD